ncbi:hypothetical protein Aperf_G00000031588 [Anoplocephala perfoliata]
MQEINPGAINIMQMVIGSKSPRFQTTFLKSLFAHHFNDRRANAAPIHLHLLTDAATRVILEAAISSWQIDNLRTTFYAAEPIQSKITWMTSSHPAASVATMKMYLPEILKSRVPQVLLLDSDIILLEDIVKLWNHFKSFDKYQFLGMALEQAPMYFNFKKIRGRRVDFGYNAGIMLWDLQKLTQKKWNAIWQPTFNRVRRISPYFIAAEQTLLNAVIVENPAIFYAIPCTWNVQMYEMGTPEVCKCTWNYPSDKDLPRPQLLHADKWDKREMEFKNNDSKWDEADITQRYIIIRSQYHLMDGYQFRTKSSDFEAFDIRKVGCIRYLESMLWPWLTLNLYFDQVMEELHPGGKVITPSSLCQTNLREFKIWCRSGKTMSFTIQHRIHPLYISSDYKKVTKNTNGVTLALGLTFSQFTKLEEVAKAWKGPISAAIEASDLQAHRLLSLIDASHILGGRSNVFYHIVFQNLDLPATIALHNTAVTYSSTKNVLFLPSLDENIRRVGELVERIMAENLPNFTLQNLEQRAAIVSSTIHGECELYAPRQDILSTIQYLIRNQLEGLLIPTKYSLLPNELMFEKDIRLRLLSLLANPSMR